MKQTAVEWLAERLELITQELFEQAQEMFEQQIKDAYADGRISVINREIISYEQYYNETFKSEKR